MISKGRPSLNALDLVAALRPGVTRRDFEKAVATKAGAQYALAFAYGHAGFYALLKALNLSDAEIIVPAYTCRVIPDVIVLTGNIPVFVEIDLADYNMDLRALKSAITPRTRMIVATHMFGYPTDIKAIAEIVSDEHIMIVEDAALAFPGSTQGSNGLQGTVALFSFGPGKPLFTMRGGLIATSDAGLYEKLRVQRDREMNFLSSKEWAKRWALLMLHYVLAKESLYGLAWRLNLSKETLGRLGSLRRSGQNGSAASELSSIPGDYATRYTDLQARIGLAQLRKADFILARRRALAQRYGEILQEVPGLTPAPITDGASYSLYSVRVRDRDAISFCQKMRARGIETGSTFNYAAASLEAFRPYVRCPYPNAEQTGQEVVNLPAYPDLTEQQARYVADSVRKALRNNR